MDAWVFIGYIAQIIVLTVAIIFCGFISMYLLYYIKIKTIPKLQMISPTIRILSIFACILYCISMISYLIGHSLTNNINWIGFLYWFTQCTWSTATCFVYILFMVRIHVTFKNTVHKINKNVYIFIFIFIVIYSICEQIVIIFEALAMMLHSNL